MAQPISPMVWQEGIDDNRLLPGRYTSGLFTGSGVKIANNNEACRVWDIQVSDYITDYDDRRLNGLAGTNADGRDGWGASAYGVFQDVRFDSRVYTMGRHRSMALRIFDEMQYSGAIGQWGTASTSNVMTNGQSLMKTAAMISKAKELWEKQVLGPDIDKYNLFAILNGHISGRWVAVAPDGTDYTDQVMDGDASHGQWVAQPGEVEGVAIPPRFAPIHGIEWDDENIPLFLSNLRVTWNNLFLPETDRVICIDPFYEFRLLQVLTGNGVPATSEAYTAIEDGRFQRLMGWNFDFTIPSQYWPKLYFDANLNVVHTADGQAAYDAVINSIAGTAGADDKLLTELIASNRMNQANFVRTEFRNGKFVKTIRNYPLGNPSAAPYYGARVDVASVGNNTAGHFFAGSDTTKYNAAAAPAQAYPWTVPGAGYGLANPTGPSGDITLMQVIGMALYRKAAQLSQEYSEMRTAEGETRGKFTECVTDVKYDAWVIERLSHGIMPIVDNQANQGAAKYGIPVRVIESEDGE